MPFDALRIADPRRLAAVAATGLLDTGPEDTFDRLTELASRLVDAPFAFVTVVDERRSFWKSCIGVGAGSPDERQNSVEESFCQYVIATNEPLVVGDARHNPMTASNPSIESMGVLAWAGFPLRSIDGDVLGTFCVVDTQTRNWKPDHLDIIETLAGAVEAQMRLRVTIDDAARLADRNERELGAREAIVGLTDLFSAANTTADVIASLRKLAPAPLGAVVVSVALPDERERELVVHLDGVGVGATDRVVELSLDDRHPIVDAFRVGSPVMIRSREDLEDRYPDAVDAAVRLGLEAIATMPLVRSDGTVLGVLTAGWSEPHEFGAHDRLLLRTLTFMASHAIERAQVGDQRRHLVESLQNELLPAVTPVPGLDVAVRYLSANTGIGFGGDWYDVIDLDDGRVVVIVGDVAGHGIEAAARMSLVRSSIAAVCRLGSIPLDEVFHLTEEILRHRREPYIATAVILMIDPASGTIDYASAGHLPALIVGTDGGVQLLDDGRRPLLGSGKGPAPTASAHLPVGGVLIAFTDGLVERRDQTSDVGTERVVDLAAAATVGDASRFGVDDLANDLVRELIGDQLIDDDVALVVVKRTG